MKRTLTFLRINGFKLRGMKNIFFEGRFLLNVGIFTGRIFLKSLFKTQIHVHPGIVVCHYAIPNSDDSSEVHRKYNRYAVTRRSHFKTFSSEEKQCQTLLFGNTINKPGIWEEILGSINTQANISRLNLRKLVVVIRCVNEEKYKRPTACQPQY